MNVGLSKSENQAEFSQRFLDAEELEVIAVDSGWLLGSGLQIEGEDGDFRAHDYLGGLGF